MIIICYLIFIFPNVEPNEHPLKYEGRTDDSYGDRHYNYVSGNERMKFPSVTTVLEKTIPNGRYFALRNWEKGSVDKHGKEGHKKLKETILNEGIEFHSVSSASLHHHLILSVSLFIYIVSLPPSLPPSTSLSLSLLSSFLLLDIFSLDPQ